MKSTLALSLVAGSLLVIGNIASAADGKAVYEAKCTNCHGPDGKANTKAGQKAGAKDLTDPKVQADLTDEKISKAVKEGLKENGKTKMKAFPDLTDADVAAVAAYVKATFKK